MPLDGSDRCPICGKNFGSAERLGASDVHRISCQLCGEYDISSAMRAELKSTTPELLPFLTAHTRQAFEFEGKPIRIDNDWVAHAEAHRRTSVHQQAHELLRVIELRTKQPGDSVKIQLDWDYPLIDAVNGGALSYYINYWVELGCLASAGVSLMQLTVKGWERLDPASGGAGIPGRVFVAMSFDPSLDAIYEQGIRRAIEDDCQMTAVRVDRIHHIEKICDRIIGEIRRAQVVVADFTDHRAGHLLWTNSTDMRTQLSERIHALVTR